MKFALLIFTFLMYSTAYTQTITYFNEDSDTVTVNDIWDYYIQLRQENPKDSIWIEEKVNHQKQMLRQEYFYYNQFKNRTSQGKYKEWDPNGQIRKDIFYQDGKLQGNIKTYWTDGKLKRDETYQLDSLLSGNCYDSLGKIIPHFPYSIQPEYKGGLSEMTKFINMNVRYPEDALDNEKDGTVQITFVVNKDGSLSEIKIRESPWESLGEEGLRVIKLMNGKWNAGYVDGELARFKMTAPIRFRIHREPPVSNPLNTPKSKRKR